MKTMRRERAEEGGSQDGLGNRQLKPNGLLNSSMSGLDAPASRMFGHCRFSTQNRTGC